MSRIYVDDSHIVEVMAEVTQHMQKCLTKHGQNSFISKHEIMGILLEEFDELRESLRKNDDNFEYELKDIAQVCIFALACKKAYEA